MKPTRDNVIVNRIQFERTSSSGLILQSNVGEPDRAQIVAIGPKVEEVKPGDVVLLNWNKAVKVEGDSFVVPETEIIFVYED